MLQESATAETEVKNGVVCDPKIIVELAVKLEVQMMKKFPDTQAYSQKARSLLFNLKKNQSLCAKILSSELNPSEVVSMSPADLASDQKKVEREQTQKENLAARRTDWATEQAKNSDKEGFFTCFKCGSKKTNFYQMQTRGADEPMTNFVNCFNCGKRWKC